MFYADMDRLAQRTVVNRVAETFGVNKLTACVWLEAHPEQNITEVVQLTTDDEAWHVCLRQMLWGELSMQEIKALCS